MTTFHAHARRAVTLLPLLGALLLQGCGGGGGGGSEPSTLTVTGTAAKGAPIAGATVAATCVSGTGTTTTGADGTYTLKVSDGEGPCLLKLTPAGGGTPLYSFTTGIGIAATANITPLTNMLVAYLRNVPGATAISPELWFAQPGVQSLLSVRSALVERILRDFAPTLEAIADGAGTPISLASADFLTRPFTASPTASPLDKLLEDLADAGIVKDDGAILAAVLTLLITAASDDPAVPPRTSGTGSSGG